MNTSTANAIPLAASDPSSPEAVYQIVQDALDNPNSAINNKNHPYRDQAVKSLRRLQIQLLDPNRPPVSEMDLQRMNMSVYKAEKLQENIKTYGTAIGIRSKLLTICTGIDKKTGEPIYQSMTVKEHREFLQQAFCPECDETIRDCECTSEDAACEICGEEFDFCDCDDDLDW